MLDEAVTELPADVRRREIASAAAALFDSGGYHQTSMAAIAAAVGVRKPTLYHYFDSKDGILAMIHDEFITLLIDRHAQRTAAGVSPDQLLLEVLADILELMETHRGHVRVFFEHHRELPDDRRADIRKKRDEYQGMVEETLADGIAAGRFRDLDTRLASLAMFGMVNWAYQWYRPGGSLQPREIAYVFADFVRRGLAAEACK